MGHPSGNSLLRVVDLPTRSAVARAVDEFLIDREAMRCTAKTLAFYRYTLGNFLAFLDGHGVRAVGDLAPAHVRAFFVDLDRRGLKDTSVHVNARAVKTFCRWLLAEELTTVDIMARVTMPRLEKRILPALTPEQVKKLLAAANERDKAMVLCLLDSGCRASEFVGLNVGDVDLRAGSVVVRQGKGRKDRVTFLGARARRELARWLRTRGDVPYSAPMWVGEGSGERLQANGLLEALNRLGKRAGVSPCSPHVFRRTFALYSLRAGADLHSLAALMGHSGLEVLQSYLDLQRDDLHEVHKRCSPGDRLP